MNGTIATMDPPPGQGVMFSYVFVQTLSRIKRTINIAAFIDACKGLNIPEEEVSPLHIIPLHMIFDPSPPML